MSEHNDSGCAGMVAFVLIVSVVMWGLIDITIQLRDAQRRIAILEQQVNR